MLAAHRAASGFLEQPSAPARSIVEESDLFVGRRLGPYRIVSELARGGMGVVYAAVRDDGAFDRKVAIKLLPPTWVSQEIRRRFQEERRILAGLDHPNIASLLDGGATSEGVLYLVMEYVEGLPIDQFFKSRELPVQRRVELFMEVCDAVHYAHQRLVVHRDIKPGNILVTRDETPKLLDFGIAKWLSDGDASAGSPRSRLIAMTPEYASPEQILGESITTASDVFSLGVVLYCLLSGQHPFAPSVLSPFLAAQAACEEDPLPPSKRTEGPLRRQLEGDLDAICLRAIEKKPNRRYGSVAELREDLRNHLEHRPVKARHDSVMYRGKRFLRRHRWGASAATLLIVMTVLFVLVTSRERQAADEARMRAERIVQVLSEILTAADPWDTDPKNQTTSSLLSVATEKVMSGKLDEDPQVRAGLLALLGGIYSRVGYVDKAEPLLSHALRLYDETCGDDCSGLADVLIYRGNVERAKDNFDAAEEFYQRALAISRQRFGEVHLDTSHAYRVLGILYHYKGDIQAAESFHRRALAIFQQISGPDSLEVATSLSSLGGVLWSHGRLAEATDHFRRALTIRTQVLEPNHPHIASTQSKLGSLLKDEDPVAAELHLRQALAAREKHLAADHESLGISRNNLGSMLLHLGRYEEAEEVLQHAAQTNRHSVYNLAMALEGLGRNEEALQLYQKSHAFYLEFWGGRDLHVGVTLTGLAGILLKMGDFELCEEKARRSLERLERVDFQPEEAPFLAEAKAILGSCLAARDQVAEAQVLLEESVGPLARDRRHRGVLRYQATLRDLASLAEARGDRARANHYRGLLEEHKPGN